MSTDLQVHNDQNKLAEWAGKISECRNSGITVKTWCKENGVCEQSYYKWQRRLFAIAQAQQEIQFTEVTPPVVQCGNVTVTVRIAVASHKSTCTALQGWASDLSPMRSCHGQRIHTLL